MWNDKLALVAGLLKGLDRGVAIYTQLVEISYLKFRSFLLGSCVNNVEMPPLHLEIWISVYFQKTAQKKVNICC